LVGFGKSKIISEEKPFLTVTDRAYSVLASPEYMSPELLAGKNYDQSSDWWSLGILIYEMVVGCSPFQSDNITTLCETIIEKGSGSVVYPDYLSKEIIDLMKQLLSMDPSTRLSSSSGRKAVASHPWFSDVNWITIESRASSGPIIPILASKTDCSNYNIEGKVDKIRQITQALQSVQCVIPPEIQNFFHSF